MSAEMKRRITEALFKDGTAPWIEIERAQMPEINLTEEEAIEAIVKVLNERRDWLPRNPYGVTALILDALGWPRSNSRQMKP